MGLSRKLSWTVFFAIGALVVAACSDGATSDPISTTAASATTVETAAPTSSTAPTTTTTTPEPCIPSGDHSSIQSHLTGVGSKAVLCPDSVFELGEEIFFTADDQQIYTRGLPTDDSRAFLRVTGADQATAIAGGHYNRVALRSVIIDGARPELGIAEGALIDFGRGIEDVDVEGQVVEWVKAYEPRGWAVLYLAGPCTGAEARHNEFGPAGQAEHLYADGISLECPNSIVEDNFIVDATDGGIVIFQSPGSVVANNTIKTENRVMFYGISMIDYLPREGDFTGTVVTGNVIDAAGAMIRLGIAMGPHIGCMPEGETVSRSRGAVVTDNVLQGDHMGYGYAVSGVEDWTVTGNVDLSTHVVPEREAFCSDDLAATPGAFQMNALTSSGTFQEDFEAVPMAGTHDFWSFQGQVSTECLTDLIGAEALAEIRSGSRGPAWEALESDPVGRRIGSCMSMYEPPDVSGVPGRVGVMVLDCEPFCISIELTNESESAVSLDTAQFFVDEFLVECHGLPDSLQPGERVPCTVDDFVTPGFQTLRWYGLPPDSGHWGISFPWLEDE